MFAIVVVLLVAVGGIIAVLVGFGFVPRSTTRRRSSLFFGLAYGLLVDPGIPARVSYRRPGRVRRPRDARRRCSSEFSERLSETYATDDVLPRMAAIVGEATRAKEVRVWLRVGGVYRVAASWPIGRRPRIRSLTAERLLPAFPGDGHRTEVRDRGELLGAITASFHANDPIDQARERLIRDMAAQAGLVLRNVGLIENLRASRQRMVAAQDEGRRRLERNIHDGAQQQLVALSVKTRLADTLIDRDTAKAHEMLAQIQADTNDALETLRDLARGIYPPLLADKGLAVALAAQGRKVDGAGEPGRRWHRTLSGRSGGDRVLLRPGGDAERVEVRAGIGDRASAANVRRRPDLRGSGRRGGLRSTDAHAGHGHPGDAGPAGRRRRFAAGDLDAWRAGTVVTGSVPIAYGQC